MSWGALADRLGEGGRWARGVPSQGWDQGGIGAVELHSWVAAIKEDVSSKPLLPSKAGDP